MKAVRATLSVLLVCLISASGVASRSTVVATRAPVDDESGTAAADFQRLSEERQHLERRVVARGRQYVRMVRAGILPIGGGFDEFSDHAARVERTRRALQRDLSQLERVERQISKLGPSTALQSRAAYDRARRDLMAKSQSAIRAEEDREAAFERAFNSSWNPAHTAVYGSGASPLTTRDVAEGFAAARGRLAFPVRGRAEIVRVEDQGGAPGLEMTARSGTVIRSVFPGRVAFIGEHEDHGLTVMVDHGQQYYTLYAGVAQISVRVGERVKDGTPLARLAGNGAYAKLYFELRAGGNRLRPAPWFGI